MARKKKLPVVRKVKLQSFIYYLGDQIFSVNFTKRNGTNSLHLFLDLFYLIFLLYTEHSQG